VRPPKLARAKWIGGVVQAVEHLLYKYKHPKLKLQSHQRERERERDF
jgi:hypothetical protein